MKRIENRLTEISISYWIIAFVSLYINLFLIPGIYTGIIATSFLLGAFVLRMEDVKRSK
jgi:hypothetical protein